MKNFPFRKHFQSFTPYSSAREECEGEAKILLDANENPFENQGKNRYPDPIHNELRDKIAGVKNQMFSSKISRENIIFGNGSDELIDLIVRLFCEPKEDSLAFCSPTFGMYQVSADMYQIDVIDIPLDAEFQLNTEKILNDAKNAKLLFLCNPNNPTGNKINKNDIEKILKNFSGMVVVDEAYIEFCSQESTLSMLQKFPNLIVLQTFSKMWGLAGCRFGMAMAHPEIIQKISALKTPYNVNILTAKAVDDALNEKEKIFQQRNTLISERIFLEDQLKNLSCIEKIFPSGANFVLVQFKNNPEKIYNRLVENGIIIRNFSKKKFLKNCMRITIGTHTENKKVRDLLQNL